MEERHKRLLMKQNPWWGDKGEKVPEFERDLIGELLKYEEYKQIIAIVGLRRVGKTVLMKQLINKWLKKVDKSNICYISFDDIDFQRYEIAEELINYFLEFSGEGGKRYLFLDEIQKLPHFADLLKSIYDTEENLKIFVSGSASLGLKEYKETLAGRIFTFHLPVLTFREFVRYSGLQYEIDRKNLLREYETKFLTEKEKYENLFDTYLKKGAFPELLEIEDEEFIKRYIKESVVEKAIKDIAKIMDENENVIYELFRLLAGSNAQLFEIINLASTLKINRNLVSKYIDLLEKSFLIRICYNFTSSIPKQVRASKKQYIAHSSIVLALLDYPFEIINVKEVSGHLVEATIVNSLKKISFWRTPRREVDIIVRDNKITPIEVKYKGVITKDDTRSIVKFCEKFKVMEGIVVTKNLLEEKEIQGNKILFIPAWLFLLSNLLPSS